METAKEAARQIAAGGAAGLVEVCLMHPLDLVKTRLQVGGSRDRGVLDCFRSTFRSEGIPGFYKGILPPILAETPKRATKFFTFEQYKNIFASPNISPAITLSLAGLCSGLTEGVIICPFEVVKVRLQAERHISLKEQKSTAAIAREIVRDGGIGSNGLYRGFTATLGRHGVWNMFYFGIYHNIKVYVPDAKKSAAGNLLGRIALGFVAGSVASVVNIPFDVAKSRIQGPQPDSGRRYHKCAQTICLVYKEEGLFALYKGLVPKIMRLGPGTYRKRLPDSLSGGAIMLIVYESAYEWLKKNT